MNIAIAQLNFHIGNFNANKTKIIEAIDFAIHAKADLVIFSELSICGYPPYDLLEFDSFIEKCIGSVNELLTFSEKIGILIGCPARNENEKGKPLYNAAWFLSEGKVKDIICKTLIPDYDIFDEYRYFEPNSEFKVLNFKGKKIAVTICEDVWNISSAFYTVNPLDHLAKLKPDFIVNLSASPFSYAQNNKRLEVLKKNAEKYQLPLFYVNQAGAQTELIFDGASAVFGPQGNLFGQLKMFAEDIQVFNLEQVSNFTGSNVTVEFSKSRLIHDALICGIRDYFAKSGLKSAILGLSGGIDSALTAALLSEALGHENVTGLLMPSAYSSAHSVDDAIQLVKNLGINHHIIPISSVFDQYLTTLDPFFNGLPSDITEENLQARIRAALLMSFSNKFGHILINTSNKSEISVGYGTLYGDLCGGISVLGDVYKTEVYELSRFMNIEKEIIPLNSILKPPSAELKPGQKDSDSLPDYEILDKILYHFIEEIKSPGQIIEMGFDEKLVKRIIKMVVSSEYKRYQAAPVLRISEKAFGTGRRIPIVSQFKF